MYYMIISVFNHMYKLNLTDKLVTKNEDTDNKEWIFKFKKYAYKWYLLQRLNNFWNENRQVSDLRRILDETNSERYITNISEVEWKSTINKYLDSLKIEATSRVIANETKLLLNYYYRLLIREDNNRIKYFTKQGSDDVFYDIEHIAPVDKFKKFKDDMPISTLGNLCYLPVKDNRSKRDKTIYEYAGDRPSLTFDKAFLNLIDYPSSEELLFLNFGFDDFQIHYLEMVNKRETNIVEKLVKLIMQ